MHDARAMIVHRDGAYRTINGMTRMASGALCGGMGSGTGGCVEGTPTETGGCCDGAYRKSVCVSGDVGWFSCGLRCLERLVDY